MTHIHALVRWAERATALAVVLVCSYYIVSDCDSWSERRVWLALLVMFIVHRGRGL